jgi:hypothetical protein
MPRSERLDRGALKRKYKTDEGYLFLDGFATRAGVFEYRRHDGSSLLELRPPEEVSSPSSLATLGRKPITDDHPPVPVTAQNYKDYAVGTVGEQIAYDEAGGFVRVSLVLHDSQSVQNVEDGKEELSCGYTAEIELNPGWWNPDTQQWVVDQEEAPGDAWVPFETIQRDIRYNHLALVDVGRAGPDVRLRTDGAYQVGEQPQRRGRDMKKIIVDGKEYEVEAAVYAAWETLSARADAADTKASTLQTEVDQLRTQVVNQQQIEDAARERVKWMRAAEDSGIEKDLMGASVSDIKAAIIQKLDPQLKLDGKSEEYKDAYLDFALAKQGEQKVETLSTHADSGAGDETPIKSAMDRYNAQFTS